MLFALLWPLHNRGPSPPPRGASRRYCAAYVYINNTVHPPPQMHFYVSGRLIPSP